MAGNNPPAPSGPSTAPVPPVQRILPPLPIVFYGRGIYIQDRAEMALFHKWLIIPRHDLYIPTVLSIIADDELQVSVTDLLAEIEATVSAEQDRRFRLVAEKFELVFVMEDLERLGRGLEEVLGVLEAEREDEEGEFDGEGFRRMERDGV